MVRLDDYDDLEILLDRGAELIQFYRNDPVIAAIDLLNVDLAPIQRIVLRDMWFKNFVITVASRGFGKSQSVDSLVYFKDVGLVYLYEVLPNIPSYLRDGEDDVIKFENEIYSSEGFVKTEYLSLEKGIKGKRLVTKHGFVNKGSNRHRLLTIDKNGNFIFKRLDQFEIGDLVCLQRGSNVFGKINIPLEDAYILGKIVGGDRVAFYDATVDGVLYKYGLDKYIEPFSFVPKIIRSSSADVVSMFLSGLFEVSECKDKDSVYIINSYDVLSVIQLMLLNFGIVASLEQFNDKYKLVIRNNTINVIAGYGIKDYFLDEVFNVEDWIGDCYDFELDMPNNTEPNYFANGFVNHNTFLLGVNALLHALLYPGYRIGLIAPSFRQCWYYGDEHFPTFWTSDGLKTGKEFFDGIVCGETKVQSLYHTNKVLNKWENIERDGLEIITEKGFIISGSLDHKILVLDKNGAFVYKELNEIDYDTNIIVLKGFECFGNNNMLPVLNLEEDWRIKKCKFPKELDEDLAYLFGLLVGDGCVSIGKRSHYRVIFVNNDVELVSSFKNLMKKYFDLEPSGEVYKNGSYHLEYYSKLVVEFFVACGVTYTTALDKKIPFVIKRSSKNCFMAFIKGLMDTDGSCYVSYNDDGKMSCEVSLSTSSEQLGREIQSVLLNIGVVSNFNLSTKSCKKSLFNRKVESNCADAYKVRITGFYNLYLYNKEISFKLSRKRNKLEKYLSTNSRKYSEFLYGLRDVCSQVMEQLRLVIPRGCSDSKYLSVIKNRLNFNTTGTVSFNIVLSLVLLIYRYKLYTDESSRLVNISELDFITVKPIKFKTKKFKTFDIEVENEHCYYANGFINHNSKMIFSEIEKLYRRSSIVREAAEKKPVRGADICYLQFKGTDRSNGSYIEALPVGVDGAKIRGSRFYLIEVDELAQMPPEIIDLVVTPMAAVSLEPMQRVRELERQRELIELGLATEEDFIDNMANKMIMTSSGYFKFNHMWERMKSYWKAADEGEGDKYAVHQIPYQLLPDGFLDKENIKKAKRTMSTIEFMMEYEAAMVSDSSGFFKASLIEECSTKTGFTVLSRGHRESEYILGVDPNQAGRAAAGLVILEIGPPHRVVYVEGAHEKTTQANVLKIYELLKSFNIVGIFMDSMGGGKAWRDLLQEGYDNNIKILDVDDKYNTHLEGKRILHLINPTTQWISDANFNLLALLENKNLLFPELPLSADPKAESIYEEVKTLKSQLVNIIVTQTARGVAHFDTPKKDQNKDLYSALVLAAWGVKELSRKQREPIKQLSNSGLIRPHQPGAKFNIASYRGNKFDGALLKRRIN